ncbi:30S ribosomal protein S19e [Nanoarchaeota archaeon]|nr:MAG: 30S ribosomal protein S19e [Nanoarchaeota archaeon]
MTSPLDVKPSELIINLASELKKELTIPEWAKFVKTGPHKERPPQQDDWWWIRAASILRALYKRPTGVERLRTKYGGRKNRGHKPERFVKASGKIIRTILQQLEQKGYVKKSDKGRSLTPEGMKLLAKAAKGVAHDK